MWKRPLAGGVKRSTTVLLRHSSCCSMATAATGLVSGGVTSPLRVTFDPEALGGSSTTRREEAHRQRALAADLGRVARARAFPDRRRGQRRARRELAAHADLGARHALAFLEEDLHLAPRQAHGGAAADPHPPAADEHVGEREPAGAAAELEFFDRPRRRGDPGGRLA